MTKWLSNWLSNLQSSNHLRNPNLSPTLKKVESHLEGYPEERRVFLAASALLMGRIAYADSDFSSEEKERLKEILEQELRLDSETAGHVASLTKELIEEGHAENHIIFRQLKKTSDRSEQIQLLRCLLAMASEDDITQIEDMEIRKVADALGFTHREYIDLRSEYREFLSVLKAKSS